ncbi:MAG: CPBP family intramembrane glutamic endopeptidase [Acholeplasmatales bacterium]|jgi:hypothetical protein|nr:CPBP family glutamic-type intramembrane protease [Acholeplasmataceae bacterium]MCK9233891.1 CPBP family glutamic-type intramembrane protease [Acholeplasmataceae bacterium]MCK9289424.1 CPBP family glutamic-type intramembrane protease [Acholeplasmataceae bacterium]MCK9427831.1 CPBP family glutamic-type intramembrane protease [Acholeplasmataceae bacterium]MDY0115238.1 CPBP family intramembrane glutamic endopeptidase [Acholeplasmatales bacterium]
MNSDNLSIYSISTLDGKSIDYVREESKKPYFFTLFMAFVIFFVVFRFASFGVAVYATKYHDYTPASSLIVDFLSFNDGVSFSNNADLNKIKSSKSIGYVSNGEYLIIFKTGLLDYENGATISRAEVNAIFENNDYLKIINNDFLNFLRSYNLATNNFDFSVSSSIILNEKIIILVDFFISLLAVMVLGYVNRKTLWNDLSTLPKVFKSLLITTLIGFIVIIAVHLFLNYITALVNNAFNASTIIDYSKITYIQQVKSFNPFFIISKLLFMPFVFELIFRKAIFKIIDNDLGAIVFSSLLFGTILSLNNHGLELLISFITHSLIGLCFACIYYKAKENIYSIIAASILFNTINFLIILISF